MIASTPRAYRAAVLAACTLVLLAVGSSLTSGAAAGVRSPISCSTYSGLPGGFAHSRFAGMVRIPSGSIRLGALDGYPDERPTGDELRIASFWMDRTEVTNAQFAAFVQATGYVTDAEREGAAAVFRVPRRGQGSPRDGDWWEWRRGANWRLPQGPGSESMAQPNEPVVLVTHADALAYARWLGHDLPTEAEWEHAARGGGSAEAIGREPRDPRGRPVANYWQGIFPDMNSTEDGYVALAPAGCFPSNGYGLVDMIGNAWELTRDRYAGPHQPHGNGNPVPALQAVGGRARSGERLVIKGGSFLCASDYCVRYRTSARHPHEADMPTSHVGFRTVVREARSIQR
jgi:sulfatase modifying factor 1